MNEVPEKLINFRVYQDGNDLLGVADAELPSLEYMSETVKGAGVAGEVESPTIGHFGKMSLKLSWRTVTKPLVFLAKPITHALDLRGAIQNYDASSGEYKVKPLRVAVRATPKKSELGKMEMGGTGDGSNEFEVIYIKIDLDGETIAEIDKYNYICIIDGTDYLAEVRKALGL
ncbi:MAG TPA: phage major tail tube protein [Methylomusa anaerophila]|uniref:Phage tail tube protein FII n=1 Tax=Methylomusa anaerophila TaxID=1930071 RepID=A0A348AJ07_9FIRM|nr:phage major tail tube protein [Methylomusa anaerophila]BBB91055.1 phage tail tube protein FII [Methylomusa anaerophila]HML88929.1 phage major tail tube protein [Methylomusa anaerophila]